MIAKESCPKSSKDKSSSTGNGVPIGEIGIGIICGYENLSTSLLWALN